MRTVSLALVALLGSQALGSVSAAETIAYKYDALGRLVQIKQNGGVNDKAQTDYKFDKADNRTEVTIVNSKPRVVVVPLNGQTVIVIPDP